MDFRHQIFLKNHLLCPCDVLQHLFNEVFRPSIHIRNVPSWVIFLDRENCGFSIDCARTAENQLETSRFLHHLQKCTSIKIYIDSYLVLVSMCHYCHPSYRCLDFYMEIYCISTCKEKTLNDTITYIARQSYNYLQQIYCTNYIVLVIVQGNLHGFSDSFDSGKMDNAIDGVLENNCLFVHAYNTSYR